MTRKETDMRNLWHKRIRRGLLVVVGAGGMVLGSNCGTGLEAITVGLSAASRALDQNQHDDDISLGDWLADEFKDL
ncbi:MAG: hypothetical protein IIC51_01380 [Planctomycetes bacterium]|nr:hypothetical protein [Planctomycetota bacterium]MCH9034162.1 hypothetical protein [Planctomycetota bacterium]